MSERQSSLRQTTRRQLTVGQKALARAAMAAVSIVGLPVRRLSGWSRRDPRAIVMGGNGGRFIDNARYLFLALAADPERRCTWITTNRGVLEEIRAMGLPAEMRWSVAGVRACLRAGWYVYDGYIGDVNYWLSRGARSLNLWHGIPMKAIEYDITSGPLATLYRSSRWSPLRLAFIDRFHTADYLLSTSPFITKTCFAPAFRMPPERCLEFGYPRTDHFFDPSSRSTSRSLLGLADDRREVLGYFPTWRDDGFDFLGGSNFSFDRMNEALVAGNRFLLFKAHPNFANIVPKRNDWSNIRILDAGVDLYQVLPACDVLVTDYSSIAYDFLVLDRPIVYFVPDHDRYVAHRNVYFSFDEMAVGPVVMTCDDLYAIVEADRPFEMRPEQHTRVTDLVWNGYRGDAIERIVEFLSAAPDATLAPRPPAEPLAAHGRGNA